MIEQILSGIKQLVTDNVEMEYPPFLLRNEFENQFKSFSEEVVTKLQETKKEYDSILNSQDDETYKQVIKITADKFVSKSTLP